MGFCSNAQQKTSGLSSNPLERSIMTSTIDKIEYSMFNNNSYSYLVQYSFTTSKWRGEGLGTGRSTSPLQIVTLDTDSQWNGKQEDPPDSRSTLTTVDTPTTSGSVTPPSTKAIKSTIIKGTDVSNENHSGPRAEVVFSDSSRHFHLFSEGDSVWYHWYTLFPNSYQIDPGWQVWTQWHQGAKTGPELTPADCHDLTISCTPTVEFSASGSILSLRVLGHVYNHNPVKCSDTDCGYKWKADLQSKIGHWFDILLHVKWSKDPTVGFMEMYVDGNKVLDKSNHFSTLDIDKNGNPIPVYLKQGLYRANKIGVDETIYHADMTVAYCPAGFDSYFNYQTKQCNASATQPTAS